MKTVAFRVPKLLEMIRQFKFSIPQFQRDFVWNTSQVKLVFDSIARNYPIGSLLVLEKSENIPTLGSRPVDAKVDEDSDAVFQAFPENEPTYYVLDGQQRLTSIARICLNPNEQKNYYIDIKRMHEVFTSTEDSSDWLVVRQRNAGSKDRRDKNRLLRADVIFDTRKCGPYVQEFVEDSDDAVSMRPSKAKSREVIAKINDIFETIRNYEIPVVILDGDAPLESICRVFETINSTGTRLTTFDLAVARFFPLPNLREKWDDSKRKFPLLQSFDLDGERVLQVLALWEGYSSVTSGDQPRFVEVTRSAILNLRRETIENRWDDAIAALSTALEWASKSTGATPATLPNQAILVVVAAAFGLANASPRGKKPKSSIDYDQLRQWYFCKNLQQGARQAANYKIARDFQTLMLWLDGKSVLDIEKVSITSDSLCSIRPSDVRYKAIQNMLMLSCPEDVITGKPLAVDSVEDHHFFPFSLHKSHKLPLKNVNSVVNRLFLEKSTNRSLGDSPPWAYLVELRAQKSKAGVWAQVERRCQAAMLPSSAFEECKAGDESIHFERFLKDRARLLLDRLREVIGSALVEADTSESDEGD
jgi:hypothetical protein